MNVRAEQINKKAQNALDMLEDTQWPIGAQVKLGAALIKLLIETACWTHDEERGAVTAWDKGVDRVAGKGGAEDVPMPKAAFLHNVVKSKKSKQGNLYLAPEVFSKVLRVVRALHGLIDLLVRGLLLSVGLDVPREHVVMCDKVYMKIQSL